jgi:HEPN domain-containing protein
MNKLTAEWVRKAEADLRAARLLTAAKPRLNDQACFHCQQAVEKYFKALVQEWGQPVPYSHDLEALLDLLLPHDASLGPLRPGLDGLTEYAVEYRYPGFHATTREARVALRRAERVRVEIRKRLKIRERRRR